MMLRDRFGIIENHRELTKNIPSSTERVLETSEMFWTLLEMFQ
jgi:hypothetical protein